MSKGKGEVMFKDVIRLVRWTFVLLVLVSLIPNIHPSSPEESGIYSDIYLFTTISLLIGLSILILFYYGGTLLGNPRITAWAKNEIVYLLTMALVVYVIFGITSYLSSLDMSDVLSLGVTNRSVSATGGILPTAEEYLIRTAEDCKKILTELQYNYGVAAVRVSLSKYGCKVDDVFIDMSDRPFAQRAAHEFLGTQRCLYTFVGGASTSWAVYPGDSLRMQVYMQLMNMVTTSLLNVLALLILLKFVTRGFVPLLLPLGVLIGAIPFMRRLGGTLIAISVGFNLFFPLCLAIVNVLWTPVYQEVTDVSEWNVLKLREDLEPPVDPTNIGDIIRDIFSGNVVFWDEVPDYTRSLGEFIQGTVAVLVSAVFMTYLALAITISAISSMAKAFGGEVDLTKVMELL